MAENLAAKVTAAFFEKEGLKCKISSDDGRLLMTGFGMKNRESIIVQMFFEEDNTAVHLMAIDLVKVPDDRKDRMYKVVNQMNAKFPWIKFVVRDELPVISAEDDAVIQLDSCGEEVLRCCIQLVGICDQAYPLLMKELFA